MIMAAGLTVSKIAQRSEGSDSNEIDYNSLKYSLISVFTSVCSMELEWPASAEVCAL